jgi:hypothetical protein
MFNERLTFLQKKKKVIDRERIAYNYKIFFSDIWTPIKTPSQSFWLTIVVWIGIGYNFL